jgi:hypothetical protein
MLDEFQRKFASGLLSDSRSGSTPEGLSLDPLRFGVYAHNARLSLTKAIENAFPVTRRLVGAVFFTAMAEQFVAAHPPTHGWLSAYGVRFPHFVAQYPPVADLRYLPDVARIEWARVLAANASDDPGLDLKALAALPPEALESLPVSLHAAASLVSSPFPVFDIWRAHQHADRDEQLAQIDVAKGSQDVLISRPSALEVGVALLGPGDVALLTAVVGHLPFGDACRAAVMAEVDYDISTRLGDLVVMRALAEDRLKNINPWPPCSDLKA